MPTNRIAATIGLALSCLSFGALGAVPPPDSPTARREAETLNRLPPVVPHRGVHIDHSGRKEEGRASYYAGYFDGREMANGHKMNPNSNIAASRTLPLGTVAAVTNLRNGKTATVRIEDRGPFIADRVVDVTPKTASQLDMKKAGVVPVVVKPIAVPLPDGQVKLGAGAATASPQEIARATAATRALTDDRPTETASR